jgi:hypothetical protein
MKRLFNSIHSDDIISLLVCLFGGFVLVAVSSTYSSLATNSAQLFTAWLLALTGCFVAALGLIIAIVNTVDHYKSNK